MTCVTPVTTWPRRVAHPTKELMHRMGHGSMRAALIYQHNTDERAREIAARLNEVVARETKRDDDDGAAGVLVPTP
jgi:hypothetical protein